MTKHESLQRRNQFIDDFLKNNVYLSWTWARLSLSEQWAFEDLISDFPLAGPDRKKWDILNHAYTAFLKGAGYTGSEWRASA